MKRDEAIALLRAHWNEISRYSVRRLALFGSVAREEAHGYWKSDEEPLWDMVKSRVAPCSRDNWRRPQAVAQEDRAGQFGAVVAQVAPSPRSSCST